MEGYRLSPQQRFLWTLHKNPTGSFQTVSCAIVLEGRLDDMLLQRALSEVIGRHEILRTALSRVETLQFPVQIIRDSAEAWLPTVDLSESSPEQCFPEKLDRMYADFREHPWDFQNGPLLQAQIVYLASSTKAVLIRASRLCCDSTGLHNVIAELLESCTGVNPLSGDQMPQYADIAEYLNETLESEEITLGRQFWKRWKSELYPSLRADHTLNPGGTGEGHLSWNAPPDLSQKAGLLAADIGGDVADVLLALWQIVLSRTFKNDSFTIGLSVSGRQLEGLDKIPGPFERILPFPCRPAKDIAFGQLIQNVASSRQQISEWQDYFSHSDFDAAFTAPSVAFEYCASPVPTAKDFTILEYRPFATLSPHQLKLVCFWQNGLLRLQISYDENVYSRLAAVGLQDQFNALLAHGLENPAQAIGKLSALSIATRNYLVHERNQTEVAYAVTPYAHQRIQAQARENPLRTAVTARGRTLTYGELDERSTRLAEALKSRGLKSEVAVAVCMERCPELLVALLAVLRTGAYYVPLDPGYPAERLRFVLADSKAALILTNTESSRRLVPGAVPIFDVDQDWESRATVSAPDVDLQPLNLAYAIYTSGSTGMPNGVAISHGALGNYLSWCEQTYDLSKGRGVIVQSPIGFDLTVTTLLAPLCVGQRLILLDGQETAEELARLLQKDSDFTLLKVTPSHLRMLNELLQSQDFEAAVNTVVVGGENLLNRHIDLWRQHAPQTRLINEYGPTEATVGCSTYEVTAGDLASGAVPIGQAIANAKLYVLDSVMQPVPFASTGELYIGGAGLARGYLGRADLTASRFVPDPFAATPGTRLYRTGDLATFDFDSKLYFLGREDEQVKLRGHRIELAEIEQALRQHPGVSDAAVILREYADQKQLLAYVAARSPWPESEQLRNFLSDRMADYMVPSRVLVLDRLPLTFHGKVDKRALPDPGQLEDRSRLGYAAPRGATEEILAGLWATALGLERVGIHDNFFELGGDSIISIQIVNRARQQGLSFTPRQLFHHRTIAELAQIVKLDAPCSGPAKTIHKRMELTPVQRWFFEQRFLHPHHWNQAMLLEAQHTLDPSALEQALGLIADRHDALRLRFSGNEEKTAFLAAAGGGPLVAELDLSDVGSEKHDDLLDRFAAEIESGLHLEQGPLMKVGLIRRRNCKDRLLWVIHHLAVDIVSWGILVPDLMAAYLQLKEHKEQPFQQRTSSFQEWSLRLAEYAQSEEIKAELDYWTAPGRRKRSSIPVDLPGGANVAASESIIWCSLGKEETSDLVQRVPKTFHTMINDVLLTALLESFYGWTGQKSLTLDLENHGREELFDDVDPSLTVGWFTCIFPVTLNLTSTYDCVLNLQSVREDVRSIPQGGLGYGLLRYVTRDPSMRRRMEDLPPSDINFNYMGRSVSKIEESPLLRRCEGALGPMHAPIDHRPYLLEITGGITGGGELRMAFLYSRNLHREQSIRKLADGFIESLREIVRCSRVPAPVPSSVDASMTQLSGLELNRLVEELQRSEDAGE